ncbi:hypothetical protein I6A62_11045 [Frankia sp. AgW1.1]|nr:hypothetical protein [Frankia sp. AgW1.1]MBL7622666.1 hypothetical protein [Frankia sp. AgB1.8]
MRLTHITRFGVPAVIVAAAVFLASSESAFMTGSDLYADGGSSVKKALPGNQGRSPSGSVPSPAGERTHDHAAVGPPTGLKPALRGIRGGPRGAIGRWGRIGKDRPQRLPDPQDLGLAAVLAIICIDEVESQDLWRPVVGEVDHALQSRVPAVRRRGGEGHYRKARQAGPGPVELGDLGRPLVESLLDRLAEAHVFRGRFVPRTKDDEQAARREEPRGFGHLPARLDAQAARWHDDETKMRQRCAQGAPPVIAQQRQAGGSARREVAVHGSSPK